MKRPGLDKHSPHGISVCMIVRDEERVLTRCLDSLNGIQNELCIVDTGSTDGTTKIAEKYGARIEHYTECNNEMGQIEDFAAARNRALGLATYEWILQIDADEVLCCEPDVLIQTVSDSHVDQVGVRLNSEGAEWISVRLFRKTNEARYESRIHEYLVHPGSSKTQHQILIKNLPDKMGKESSSDRNIRLCKSVLSSDPENSRILHYLGNEYRKKHQFRDAVNAYSRSLANNGFRIGKYHTSYYLAVCHLILENWEEAVEAALLCIKIDPRYAEAPCLLGDVYSNLGEVEFALRWYKIARDSAPPLDAVMAIQAWSYYEHPNKRIDEINQKLQHNSQ